MNHEFWNEIGNLYFMCGAYEPAIHAYLRSIKLENTFGRSYSNLAMAYVQTGKYHEAIKLYRRSIELLSNDKEKAITWNRLGILYRQIKEYDNALEAYQRADLIMPQTEAEKLAEVRADEKLPLTVSMPELDLDAILAKGNLEKPQLQSDLLTEINSELETAEADHKELSFEEMVPTPEFETYSQPEELKFEPPINTQSEWKFAYADEILQIEEEHPAKQELIFNELEDLEIIIPVEIKREVMGDAARINTEPTSETQPQSEGALVYTESENIISIENNTVPELMEVLTNEAEENPEPELTDVTPEERQALAMEIIKYQQATTKHPRSYILWEGLGEAYKSVGQYRNAIQAFQKAISLNPTNHMCHYRLGLVYAAERKEQDAIKSFTKVLELDPNSAQAHASLASQYRKLGFEQVAQEHIEKARAMQFDGESDYNHACLEAICGNNERALELLEVALESKQTYVTWAQNDPDFDNLRSDHRFQILLSNHATLA